MPHALPKMLMTNNLVLLKRGPSKLDISIIAKYNINIDINSIDLTSHKRRESFMETQKTPFVIVWNQENIKGYHMLPKEYSVLKVWALSEEDAIEKASIKIMLTLQRELEDVECKVQRSGKDFEVLVTSETDRSKIARVFDIHAIVTD